MRIIGYGICGPNEAERYMRITLDSFKRVCDDVIILGNNITDKERNLIAEYGYSLVEDNREWGKYQWLIKEEFVKNHVAKLKPDWTVCLDMDEELDSEITRETFDWFEKIGQSFYLFVVNLWDDGWNRQTSFQNIRIWSWKNKDQDFFFEWKKSPVHCGLAPQWTYFYGQQSPFILKHYGLKDESVRMNKVERYKKYDPNKKYTNPDYYHWLEHGTKLLYNEESVKKEAREHFDKINLRYKAPKLMKLRNETWHIIKRVKDGTRFYVEEKDLEHHLRPGFEYIGKKGETTPSEATESPVTNETVQEVQDELTCTICGYKAKTKAGLAAHMRKHK